MTLPLIQHFVNRPDAFVGRSQAVSVFRPEYVRQLLGPGTLPYHSRYRAVTEQLRRVLSIFVQYGDAGGSDYANVPGFDAVTASLIWLGMGVALARARRFYEMVVLLWFWLWRHVWRGVHD